MSLINWTYTVSRPQDIFVFADSVIPISTCIFAESPMTSVLDLYTNVEERQKIVNEHYDKFTDEEQQIFLSMHNKYPASDFLRQKLDIFETVSLSMEGPDAQPGRGVFSCASRLTHSCEPNAKHEEITIRSFEADGIREQRQILHIQRFGFPCSCSKRALPPDLSLQSDQQVQALQKLRSDIGGIGQRGIVEQSFDLLQLHCQLVEATAKYAFDRAMVLFSAAQVAYAIGDLVSGKVFASLARDRYKEVYGIDSAHVKECNKYLTNSSITVIDWLQRRGLTLQPRPTFDLRNRSYFPTFSALPTGVADRFNFYITTGTGALFKQPRLPSRHWRFLAQIVDLKTTNLGLLIIANDLDGNKVTVSVETAGKGKELKGKNPDLLVRGHTIAVLYANGAKDEPVIRVQDIKKLRIFRLLLSRMMELNGRIQQSSGRCHTCGHQPTSLSPCTKCKVFSYCNKVCENAGRRDRGHDAECKDLGLGNLHELFLSKWDNFNSFRHFPLDGVA
ncbi:hypothetical protein BT63DRAFT_441201 [Microthyrium microscopicum]|uniref:MYND-type domain-containing protein n=1 Tax=Microthyrium microscopicum TaxID=703497 RepID=A0A6A6U5Z7_9PEZI|nr:hypothetical protein BT63DRAFT_441201 [Microthyrium microscopicum]